MPRVRLQLKNGEGAGHGSASKVLVIHSWRPETNPQNTALKKSSVVACTCNPGTGKMKTGRPRGPHWPVSPDYVAITRSMKDLDISKIKWTAS